MSRQIFPASVVEFSEENLIQKHSHKSKIIYWILILMVSLFGVAIFFVKIDINAHTRGFITSKEHSTNIISPVSGNIKQFNLEENLFIEKGDTLLMVDTLSIKRSIMALNVEKMNYELQNQDLLYLSQLNKKSLLKSSQLETALYKQELQKFRSDLRFQKSEIAILKKEFKRQKKLFTQKVISKSEFEKTTFKYESQKLKYHKIFDNQLTNWQKQLNQNKTLVINLNEKLNNLNREMEDYFIIAPISGYIQKLTDLKINGLLNIQQNICSISPTTDLIVETFVPGADIGLIRMDQPVKFRVDAFNFNQWGMLEGHVMDIAKDIHVQPDGLPSFKIRCKLDDTALNYQNKTVTVKKGMAISANFFLTERTLAQLLYDKISDWIDPNTLNHKTN